MKDDWQHLLVDRLRRAMLASGKTLESGLVGGAHDRFESELK
jgi:hypothetical protein